MVRHLLRCVLVAGSLLPLAAHAAPRKDRLELTALASAPGGAVPTIFGSGTHNWFYPPFCTPDGALIQDFPVSLRLFDGNDTPGEQATVRFRAVGALASSTTVPADVTLTDDGSAAGPFTISLNVAGLAPGTYALNVKVSTRANVEMKNNVIHIRVIVAEGCGSPSICFYSDSEFANLLDCASDPVPGATGGTFKIVPKGLDASVAAYTTPDSLYYNMIWTNPTGADQDVIAKLAASGTVPVGPDAVHALLFDSGTFVADLSSFDMVNANGTPCGPSGPCTVTVPVGMTLWLTWHVAWAGVGGPTAGISAICPGDQNIAAFAQLAHAMDPGGLIFTSCGAAATGFKTACPSGDVNGDGVTDILDVFYLSNFLFAQGAAPICGSGDVNGDQAVDPLDIFYLINYLLSGGPPPV